jgi:hypothetical protein
MLPIVKPYQAKATYAGLPTESYSKLIDSVASTFDKNKTAARALDIALSQIKYNEGDKPLAEGIINKYKEAIDGIAKDAAGNTRYDLATQQVDNTMLDFAKNTNLQHIGKQWAAAEEDRKRLLDPDYNIKYIGEPNTKDFRSINPDGTLNYYKPTVETRLKHEDKAKEIISRVSPEIINSVEGLSDQEKQMIGSQGLYKFITTEKKDSDTYKKVWNYIRNVAKSTPELDQYLRFKGEDALDSLLLNEGLLTQYQNQKVNIQQKPTIETTDTAGGKENLYGDATYADAFRITPSGDVSSVATPKVLSTDYEDKFEGNNNSDVIGTRDEFGRNLGTQTYKKIKKDDTEDAKFIKELIDTIPSLGKYKGKTPKDLKAAAIEYNKYQKDKIDEANNLFASGKTLNIESSLALQSNTFLDNLGDTINSGSSDVFLLGDTTKDKAKLQDKIKKSGKTFDFDSDRESTFTRILVQTKGDTQAVGFVYNLVNKKGESQEVVKYDNELSSKLKPVLQAKENLYSLVKNHSTDIKEGTFKGGVFNFKTAEGQYRVQPVYGNLTRFEDFKTLSAIYKTAGNSIGERPAATYKVIDPQGNVDYYTPVEYDEFIKQGVVNNSFIRNSFEKTKDSK